MPKLVVLADDFTGAMDTGVQMAKQGIDTCVSVSAGADAIRAAGAAQVLVVDTESRHLPPKQAYEIARLLARCAAEAGVPYLYSKIDSTFRGNIGAQLQGVYEGFGCARAAFVPAYPELGRTSREMTVYVDGVLLADTPYAKDLLNPVHSSSIREIIAEQSELTVFPQADFAQRDSGVFVFDCQTQEDLRRAADTIFASDCRLFSGCAGFAAQLGRLVSEEKREPGVPRRYSSHLAVSGSVHPNSLRQLQEAQRGGVAVHLLSAGLKLCGEPLAVPEGKALLTALLQELPGSLTALASVSHESQLADFEALVKQRGDTPQQAAEQISGVLAQLTAQAVQRCGSLALTVFGGDTAVAIMRRLGITAFRPVCELQPGVPYCELDYNGRTVGLVTKAGGFGTPDVLRVADSLLRTGR